MVSEHELNRPREILLSRGTGHARYHRHDRRSQTDRRPTNRDRWRARRFLRRASIVSGVADVYFSRPAPATTAACPVRDPCAMDLRRWLLMGHHQFIVQTEFLRPFPYIDLRIVDLIFNALFAICHETELQLLDISIRDHSVANVLKKFR